MTDIAGRQVGGRGVAWPAALAIVLVAVAAVTPVYALALVLLVVSTHSRRVAILCALLFMLVVFSAYNLGRGPSSDWLWYTRHYQYILENGVQRYFGLSIYEYEDLPSLYGIAPRITEPLFYLFCLVVGTLSGGSVEALSVAVTVAVYLPVTLVCIAVASSYTRDSSALFAVAIGAGGLGIVFTLTNHLVRQELAMAALFPAVYLLLGRRYIGAALFGLVAILTHNSAAVVVVLIVGAAVAIRLPARLRIPALIAACIAVAAGTRLTMGSERVDAFQDDGSVSASVYLLDGVIVLATAYFSKIKRDGPDYAGFLIALVVMLAAFLIMAYPVKLLFLRMYFYMDLVRTLCLAVVISGILSRWPTSLVARGAVVILALVYVDLRIASSPFLYAASLISPWMNL